MTLTEYDMMFIARVLFLYVCMYVCNVCTQLTFVLVLGIYGIFWPSFIRELVTKTETWIRFRFDISSWFFSRGMSKMLSYSPFLSRADVL